MVLKNINHGFEYHTRKIATMFFPLEKISEEGKSEITVVTSIENNMYTVSADVMGKSLKRSRAVNENEDMARAMSLLLFGVLSEITGFTPPWGILYGVRPARLMHAKCDELGYDGAKRFFLDSLVTPEKTALAFEVMESENEIIKLSKSNSCSLYVSIPFCPTRCSYCSFVSHSIENAGSLIDSYVELLCKELETKAKVIKDLGLRLETVYFGGGTPTTLSASQLAALLKCIEKSFDLSTLREYTVEAGRPDTVTPEKLEALKAFGVNRISINPQTFNDEVRAKIGRRHTTAQTLEAFEMARRAGFININTDLIAGLEGESLDSFENSVKSAVSLGAESVTVHNLSLKSGAYLVTEKRFFDLEEKLLPSKMLAFANSTLRENDYSPYYMYRQSKALGNLENVGWSKSGFECLYNVFMMDETHTVLAAGAGAVTKLKDQKSGHIERIYNYKYPYEYINNFDEVLSRIDGIYTFYGA